MDIRLKLNDFVTLYNSKDAEFFSGMLENAELFNHSISHSYLRQFTQSGVRDYIGISSLGKPAVQLGFKKLKYEEVTPSLRTKLTFFVGDAYEILLTNMLRSYGFSVTLDQHDVTFHGVGGHLDGVIDHKVLIEIKTMNDRYFESFTKCPDDTRGYITQLGIYSHCMGLPAVWLCVNKVTNELKVVELPEPEYTEPYLARAASLAQVMNDIKSFEDLFNTFEAPTPVAEVFKKQETGKYLMPQSMAYWNYSPVFYKMVLGTNGYNKPTVYIEDFNDYDEAYKVLVSVFSIPF